MIAPYDHDALWTKAKVFLNRAMDPGNLRSFDEQALWASAALELLGKAALAKASPLLIAEPSEDGTNILIASGLIAGDARFTSVSASTIFKRCAKAFRPFNALDAQSFAEGRNDYLHGPGLSVMTLPANAWWAKYWALAAILVNALDQDISVLVGSERTKTVADYLARNSKNIEHQTESLLSRARQRLSQYRAGTLPAKLQLEWDTQGSLVASLSYHDAAECPACGGAGTIEGETSVSESYQYDYDEDGPSAIWLNVTVGADYFSCPTCHLVLDGFELISQAGLEGTFETINDDPPPPQEYGND